MNRKQSVRIRQASVSDIEALVPFLQALYAAQGWVRDCEFYVYGLGL